MDKITKSGVYYDEFGQLIVVTQGLGGYTLVAGKKILFRLFLDLSATSTATPLTVAATITFKIFGLRIRKSFVIPSSSLLIEKSSPNGPSVGVVFKGDAFPFPTGFIRCEVEFHVLGVPTGTRHFKITEIVFQAPGRLRLLIHNLVGTAPWGTRIEANFSWLIEMFQSLERLSAMLPVRDGIKLGLTHTDVGLCFIYGENINPWPEVCPSGNPPPCTSAEMVPVHLRETEEINALGTAEKVDATVSWRPRDLTFPAPGGEGVGGKAISYNSPAGKGLAGLVGGNMRGTEFTAAILAQEIGHLFGLEPKDSPHFEDPNDGLHSKDPGHFDPFAFDFDLMKPYQPPANSFVGDVMNNSGGGVSRGRDLVLYNAFDWEHLRKKFLQLPGANRSGVLAQRPSSKRRNELVSALHGFFAGEPEIKLESLRTSLPATPGHAWHWTASGFQLTRSVKRAKTSSGLANGVEDIRAWLEHLGIKQAYAPVGDRPLQLIVSPGDTAHRHREFDAF